MPVPPNSAAASSVNGTLVAATLTLQPNDHQARVVLTGTYTGVTGTIDVSMDGTTWINRQAIQEDTGVTANGTISPSASNLSYVVDCDGWYQVRFNCTACTTGTCVQTVYSANSLNSGTNPIIANTSSTTSFTSGTFSGTLGVTGTSTLGVLSAGGTTVTTLHATGAATLDSTLSCTALTATSIAATGTVALTDTMTITDAKNIVINTTTGTKIGTGTTQKIGFFNATPIVQPANTVDYLANLVNLGFRASGGTAALAAPGLISSSSPTGGIGYATGAGGAVTQATDKTTGATSNTITTAVTLNNASLAAATIVAFTFTNSAIAATDTVVVTHQSAGTSGAYTLNAFPAAGSAVISIRNNTAGALAEAIVLRVTVIKSVSA